MTGKSLTENSKKADELKTSSTRHGSAGAMMLKWCLSRTVRQDVQMRRHVSFGRGAEKKVVLDQMTSLEGVANKWLKPYPSPALRENIEVMVVAIAVAMGIRTFFLQPFKIPTGSMQPTLFGIVHEDLRGRSDQALPNPLQTFWRYWVYGEKYIHVIAKAPGEFRQAEPPTRFILFNIRQRFQVGDEWYTIWFPPDQLFDPQYHRAGIDIGQRFSTGDDIIKLKVF